MSSKIWLSPPHMGGTEENFVKQAFDTNWIAPLGPNVDGFEADIANFLGEDITAAALISGTAALHIGLILLGVKPGDEVICQDLTFSATANAIAYVGAVPVFVDSEQDTWNMCPELLEEAIKDRISLGKKPAAILPVHLYGMPAKIHEIEHIGAKYGIPVLEDAAEALGSKVLGRKCGTFGDISVLSFNGNKIITTSGGGALMSKNKSLVEGARFLSTQARDAAPHYQHSKIGYNYRLSNLCAGVGRGQFEVLEARIEQRRKNFDFYQHKLGNIEGVTLQKEPEGYFSNRWLTTLLIEPEIAGFCREDVRLALEKDNIESRPLWKPMHMQPIFEKMPVYLNGWSEALFKNGLCLPSGSSMTEADLTRVCSVILNIPRRQTALAM
jgi:dTDP-4-amino-4,6-dideoxygalactose transaminase